MPAGKLHRLRMGQLIGRAAAVRRRSIVTETRRARNSRATGAQGATVVRTIFEDWTANGVSSIALPEVDTEK